MGQEPRSTRRVSQRGSRLTTPQAEEALALVFDSQFHVLTSSGVESGRRTRRMRGAGRPMCSCRGMCQYEVPSYKGPAEGRQTAQLIQGGADEAPPGAGPTPPASRTRSGRFHVECCLGSPRLASALSKGVSAHRGSQASRPWVKTYKAPTT
ncbi:hypothetical protein CMUS01_09009 [Colletotrichum musicola]|uniref:Uncharacterized protein n=1 Tax=Colletotrichum musicola TaxID=2175873 RepID=A0A8H6K9C4_9PEZI|nr:hypothetical protein CMUS01_09009 [Colletotrichum musicola]